MISIVTINLNHADGLRRTLQSVVGQSYRNWEIIVIDGGSEDQSVEVANEFRREIRQFRSEHDKGIYHAMNKGASFAQGSYLYFLNSGDQLFSPASLENVAARLEFDLHYGDDERVGPTGKREIRRSPELLTPYRFYLDSICHQTCFYKKTVFDRLGGFSEEFRIVSDWELNLRLVFENYTKSHLGLVVAKYEGGGLSSVRTPEHEKERRRAMERIIPRGVLHDYERLRKAEEELRQCENRGLKLLVADWWRRKLESFR